MARDEVHYLELGIEKEFEKLLSYYERKFPVGSPIKWKTGKNIIHGEVIDTVGNWNQCCIRFRVRSKSGKTYWISKGRVVLHD